MRQLLPRWLRITVALLVSAALMHWAGVSEVTAKLAAIPALVLLCGLAIALLSQWLGAVRLRLVARAQGLSVTVAEAWSINLSAVFYGLFLPGGSATGWAVRLIRLSGETVSVGTAVRALTSDRVCATATLAMIGLAMDALLGAPTGSALSAPLVAITIITALFVIALFGLLPSGASAALRRSRVGRWLDNSVITSARGAPGARASALLAAILLSLCMHLIGIVIWFVIARSLGIDLGAGVIAWVRSAAMVIAMLPISVGGLGLREGATVYLLAVFGVTPADALSLSLAVFAVTVVAVGLVGGLGEAWRFSVSPKSSSRV